METFETELTVEASSPGLPHRRSTTAGSNHATGQRHLIHTALLIVILCVFAANTLRWSQAGEDPDFWWHLRTGNWILSHGAIPKADLYAWTTAGKPWIVYHWLFDIAAAKLFQNFGLRGAIALIAALCITSMWLLAVLLGRYTGGLRAAILAASVEVSMFALRSPRPWLVTILFFIVELSLLLQACERRHWAWLTPIPVVLALWANLHIEFVIGLALIGLFALQQCIPSQSKWALPTDGSGRSLSAGWLWGLLGVASLATLANPAGWRLYTVFAEYAAERAPLQVVSEMQAMGFRDFTDWTVLLLVAGAWFALGRMQRRPAFLPVLLIASCWLGFRSQREIWFPAIVSVLVIAFRFRETEIGPRLPAAYWALAAVATSIFTIVQFPVSTRSEKELQSSIASHYPVAASAYIQAHHLAGPLFNGYMWGSYLIWRLPEMQVSIDGRANLHGDERLLLSARTGFATRNWAENPDLRKAKTIVLEDDSPLASVLRSDSRYRMVYEDKVAAVFQPVP